MFLLSIVYVIIAFCQIISNKEWNFIFLTWEKNKLLIGSIIMQNIYILLSIFDLSGLKSKISSSSIILSMSNLLRFKYI